MNWPYMLPRWVFWLCILVYAVLIFGAGALVGWLVAQ